jgi:hypothetical protein
MRGQGRREKASANHSRPLAEWLWHEAAQQVVTRFTSSHHSFFFFRFLHFLHFFFFRI